MRVVGRELILPPDQAPPPGGGDWHAVGSGWAAYGDALGQRLGAWGRDVRADLHCHAQDIARIAAVDLAAGLAVPAQEALPVYLRDRVAWRRTP